MKCELKISHFDILSWFIFYSFIFLYVGFGSFRGCVKDKYVANIFHGRCFGVGGVPFLHLQTQKNKGNRVAKKKNKQCVCAFYLDLESYERDRLRLRGDLDRER